MQLQPVRNIQLLGNGPPFGKCAYDLALDSFLAIARQACVVGEVLDVITIKAVGRAVNAQLVMSGEVTVFRIAKVVGGRDIPCAAERCSCQKNLHFIKHRTSHLIQVIEFIE